MVKARRVLGLGRHGSDYLLMNGCTQIIAASSLPYIFQGCAGLSCRVFAGAHSYHAARVFLQRCDDRPG